MNFHLTGTVMVDGSRVLDEVWVSAGTIHYNKPDGECIDVHGFFVPGLVDMHCHVGVKEGERGHAPATIEESIRQAQADLATGVLLIRDAGSLTDTHPLDERTDLPIIRRAGRHIARTKRYLPGLSAEVEPEDLGAEIARQAQRSDGWVKLVIDWIDRKGTGDLSPLWPSDVLNDAVKIAHDNGARITVHTFGAQSLEQALDAGVDCIEHATGADETLARRIAEQNIPVVPTMLQRENFAQIAKGADRYPLFQSRMADMFAQRFDQLVLLAQCGVTLLAGTDTATSIVHGSLPAEMDLWLQAGLGMDTVLAGASWNARLFLGFQSLEDGAPADLVGYDMDVRNETAFPRSPMMIMRDGVQIQ